MRMTASQTRPGTEELPPPLLEHMSQHDRPSLAQTRYCSMNQTAIFAAIDGCDLPPAGRTHPEAASRSDKPHGASCVSLGEHEMLFRPSAAHHSHLVALFGRVF